MTDNMELKDAATTGVSYGTVESTLVNRRKGAFKSVWDDDSYSDSGDEDNDKDKKPRIRFVFRWSDLIIILVYLAVSAIGLYFALSRMLPQAEKLRLAFYNTTIPEGPTPLVRVPAPPMLLAWDDPPCRQLARDLLDTGGNAVDAAIALTVCNVALRPQAWSLGGGLVMLVYNRTTRQAHVIDALPSAPKNLSVEEFHKKQGSVWKEAETLGVPGVLAGLELANKRFGRLAWHYKLDPVADLCERGFNVTESLGRVLSGKSGDLWNHPDLRVEFVREGSNDELLREGETLRRPSLSETLRRVAKLGAKEFYTGVIAKLLLRDIAAAGGLLTADDLASYEAHEYSAANVSCGAGSWLLTSAAPSGGPALAMAGSLLRTLGPLMFAQDLPAQYRAIVEVFKQSLGRRLHATVSYYNDTQAGMASRIMDGDLLQPLPVDVSHALSDPGVPESVAVVDSAGDIAIVYTELHGVFGSHFLSNSTGVIFNGALREFPTASGGEEEESGSLFQPGARVPSPAAPALVVDDTGDVQLLFTSDGPGNQTLTAAIQFLWRALHTNVTLKQAIDAPRLHHPLVPDVLYAEYKFPGVILQKLHTMGYQLETLRTNSSLRGVQRDNGTYLLNQDYRIVF
uniref:Gamma-glutamyltranspeptidase / glutathione hydrolase / leukotriene-C4 hydrolase n=1 Tax=Rhipicephalus appendiculatus TaxID=34631 RepID=A0A131Z122_RHIAP